MNFADIAVFVIVVLFLSGCAAIGFWLVGAVAKRLPNPLGALGVVTYVGLIPTGLISTFVLLVTDFPAAVSTAALGTTSGLAATLLIRLTAAFGAVVVVTTGSLGLVPAVRDVRDVEMGFRDAGRRMGRYATFVTVFAVVLFTLLNTLVANSISPLTVVVGIVVSAFGLWVVSPFLELVSKDMRPPTETERERLESLCIDANLDVDSFRVYDDGDARVAARYVRGSTFHRRLVVTQTFFDAFDEHQYSFFVLTASRLRVPRLEFLFGYLVGLLVFAALALFDLVSLGVVLVVVLVSAPVALAVARRLLLRADDKAVERVGVAMLVDALEHTVEFHGLDESKGGIRTLFSPQVPVGRRIERLRRQANEA
ncbi:hypothetical protein [Haloprofundus salinisoli]|uniref:hypothetical protein n=1 Tax=Haloprofundus salinisoli TaxID=2876193 RepID=UPI001CCE2C61|nr:hypothetical protein [Haloprofundus salinisoli]